MDKLALTNASIRQDEFSKAQEVFRKPLELFLFPFVSFPNALNKVGDEVL